MLSGRVCVITGATSGIGRATALALAAQGAYLELLGRNAERGAALVRAIQSARSPGSARFHPVDLSIPGDIARAVDAISTAHPAIDVLVNNAGARYDHYTAAPDGLEMTFAANHLDISR